MSDNQNSAAEVLDKLQDPGREGIQVGWGSIALDRSMTVRMLLQDPNDWLHYDAAVYLTWITC